jgi:G3E family GTPase
VERELRAINGTARIVRTQRASLPLQEVLNLGAFDLDRALRMDERFLEPVQPFEWAGSYPLAAGHYHLHAGAIHGPQHGHDDQGHGHDHGHAGLQRVKLLLLLAIDADTAGIESLLAIAAQVYGSEPLPLGSGAHLPPGRLVELTLGGGAELHLDLPESGHWVLFTEHAPVEFGLHLHGHHPQAECEYGSHHHDAEIGSMGISDSRELNADKVNDWLSYLLQSRGQDILRMKGILAFKGEPRRYVFHGVHMIFDGKLERPWGDAPRGNRLVFIGRNLDRRELQAGFESCIA